MAKSKEQVMEDRSKRAQAGREEREEAQEKMREVRQVRNDAIKAQERDRVEKLVNREAEEEEEQPDPVLLDGKPGSGAGLKPGDWFAPASNPGAAARVPTQPLQPESMQSHGKGILYDKDVDNPPFDGADDPEEVDAAPYGSRPGVVDKELEREKAEKITSRQKQRDPDNPTIGAGGRKDATASPNPVGSTGTSKNRVSGGSNSGEQA